jgi:HAE1 family hydrophobic/amphiphilic exporter-1
MQTKSLIDRPVQASVISIFLVLLGLLALATLPRAQFPAIAPPEVNVTVEYTGANAETVTKAAIVPLERSINGVPGMKYMSSDAGNDGVGVIQVIFEVGTDPDVAAVNVQNRVASVTGELPEEIIKNGVKIAKEENAMLMFIGLYSDDGSVDEKFLYNFADINLLAEIKRIPGVGYADIVGAKEYAMRVWLDPERLAAFDLGAGDIIAAIQANSLEAAPGKLGENSDRAGSLQQYVVRHRGKIAREEDFRQIPVRTGDEGQVLRLGDVAELEFSTTYFDVEAKLDGHPTATILLKQLPGSNANQVIQDVKNRLAELAAERFLPGMHYTVTYDVSRLLEASVAQVVKTLLEAFLLVALVTFVFLKEWRATAITLIAVPVSLIGSLIAVKLLGFSLNLITLFAVLLSIGIVVDNAIVVVEAIESKLRHGATSVPDAARETMQEIRTAIISITLVMSAVFIPVAFLGGPAGIFMRQFSLTMASAIVLSGIVALTLTPALCARFMRATAAHPVEAGILGKALGGFERMFTRCTGWYTASLEPFIRRRAVTVVLLLACVVGAVGTLRSLPVGFIPQEDAGVFYASVTSPPGSSLEYTKAVVDQIQAAVEGLEGIASIVTLAGTNVLSDGTGATYGTVQFALEDWSERQPIGAIMEAVSQRIVHIKSAAIELFPPPTVPGYGNASGFELRVLDRTGSGDLARMQSAIDRFIQDLRGAPEIGSAFTIFESTFPQYVLDIDLELASRRGIDLEDVLAELQVLLGGEYAVNFIRFGQLYKVMVQAKPEYRRTPEDLLAVHVRSESGGLVPLGDFVQLERSYGVDQVTRYNMYPSAEVNGSPAPGSSSGEAIRAIERVAQSSLPPGYGIDWAGMTKDEVETGGQSVLIIGICLVFVYLLLAAQYESFRLPLPVMLSLPGGLLGAAGALAVLGLENNIYAQAAILMLIGLLGKNAILIVEFASQSQRRGLAREIAARDGAAARFRAIVMTSLAMIAGLLPLLFSSGVGAIGNRTVGGSASGGMFVGTLLGLYLVPGLYVLCASRTSRRPAEREVPVDGALRGATAEGVA